MVQHRRAWLGCLVFGLGCAPLPTESDTASLRGGEPGGIPQAATLTAPIEGTDGSAFDRLCTGVVIAPHTLLTAAHCVVPDRRADGVLFEPDFSRAVVHLPLAGGQIAAVRSGEVTRHWSYPAEDVTELDGSANVVDYGSDLAVVGLEQAIDVAPLEIPSAGARFGSALWVNGRVQDDVVGDQIFWTQERGLGRDLLNPYALRTARFDGFRLPAATTESGDSGGPLYSAAEPDSATGAVLYGVVSGSPDGAGLGTAARVDYVRDWIIDETARRETDCAALGTPQTCVDAAPACSWVACAGACFHAGTQDATVCPSCFEPSIPTSRWKGEYFLGHGVEWPGAESVMIRDETNQMLWGGAAPAPESGFLGFAWSGEGVDRCFIGSDAFSVRWTRRVSFPANATVTFELDSDDGARLYLDGVAISAEETWAPHGPRHDTLSVPVLAGEHELRLEYYQEGGLAEAKLSWH